MATHSSILAWRISWTDEPVRQWSMGWQRVRDGEEEPSFLSSSQGHGLSFESWSLHHWWRPGQGRSWALPWRLYGTFLGLASSCWPSTGSEAHPDIPGCDPLAQERLGNWDSLVILEGGLQSSYSLCKPRGEQIFSWNNHFCPGCLTGQLWKLAGLLSKAMQYCELRSHCWPRSHQWTYTPTPCSHLPLPAFCILALPVFLVWPGSYPRCRVHQHVGGEALFPHLVTQQKLSDHTHCRQGGGGRRGLHPGRGQRLLPLGQFPASLGPLASGNLCCFWASNWLIRSTAEGLGRKPCVFLKCF